MTPTGILTNTQLIGHSSEWYTPPMYIEAVTLVLNGIELDPASCEYANRFVQATRYFTKEQDGLKQEWKARSAFLNPPYGTTTNTGGGRSNIGLFTRKMIDAYQAGDIAEAIMLVRADPGARWFKPFWDYLLCFVEEDIYFEREGGSPTRHRHGTAFVYLGSHPGRFKEVFSFLGVIVGRAGGSYGR